MWYRLTIDELQMDGWLMEKNMSEGRMNFIQIDPDEL